MLNNFFKNVLIGSIIKLSVFIRHPLFSIQPCSIRDPSHVGLGSYFAAPQNPKVLLLIPVPVVRDPLPAIEPIHVHQLITFSASGPQARAISGLYLSPNLRRQSNTPSSRSYMLGESGEMLQLLHPWEYKCDLGPLAQTDPV